MARRLGDAAAVAGWFLRRTMSEEPAAAVVGDLVEEIDRRRAGGTSICFPGMWLIGQAIAHAFLYRVRVGRMEVRMAGDTSRPPWSTRVSGWAQDCRAASRSLRRRPAFFAAAVATLAVGIGMNAAMFSVVNRLLLKSLPYRDAGRLVQLSETAPDFETIDLPFRDFAAWRAEAISFESMAAFDDARFVLMEETAEPTRIEGALASASLFDVLGVTPALGRYFTADEERPGNDAVVVLGHSLWKERYAADPAIIGRAIVLNGRTRVVIGIGPERFRFPEIADLWVPLAVRLETADPENFSYDAIARLRPGVTLKQATAEGAVILQRVAEQKRVQRKHVGVQVYPLRRADVSPAVGLASVLLLLAVGAVLAIACLNLAVLVSARAMSRRHELAVRAALGADRGRLITHLAAETVLVTGLGAIGGVFIGSWLTQLVNASLPAERPFWMVAELDGTVLVFVMCVAVLSTLVVGVLPALQTLRGMATSRGARGPSGAFMRRQRVMVAFQVAMTLALLVGATAMLDAVRLLERQDIGAETEGVATIAFELPRSEVGRSAAVHAQILESLRALPGVTAAGLASDVPLLAPGDEVLAADAGAATPATGTTVARTFAVSPGFIEALGLRVVAGQTFSNADEAGVVISQSLARRFWPDGAAVGRYLRHGVPGLRSPVLSADARPLEIIGVVGDVRRPGRADDTRFVIYRRQSALARARILVRTATEPLVYAAAIRQRVRDGDPAALVGQVGRLSDAVGATLNLQRLYMRGFAAFSALAIGLAAVGMWGIAAFATNLRRGELAVRRAVGALDRAVLTLLLRQSARSVVPGLLMGALLAWGLLLVLRATIPGVALVGFSSPAMAAAGFGLIALGASYLPARRALSIEPSEALRAE
jgi:putative ABC transport system permease protein